MERKIIILGSGPDWQSCPFKSTDREIWAVAKMVMLDHPPTKVDMLFSMDDIDYLLTIRRGDFTKDEFVANINDRNVRYISTHVRDEIVKSKAFPFKEIVNRYRVPYFTNTICYMIAYALWKGVTHIDFYGVAQMAAFEYSAEKAGVEFWLGMAAGLGVKINFKTMTALLKNPNMSYPYGYVETIDQLMDKES